MAAEFFAVNPPREENRRRMRVLYLDELSDDEIINEYRLTRRQIYYICEMLKDELTPIKDAGRGFKRRNSSLEEKVLISLKTLASGSFQNSSKDNIDVAKITVSKVLNDFVDALFKITGLFIRMPATKEEQRQTMGEFYDIAGFPGVLGCIDCTHIPIKAPSAPEQEYAYVNKKGVHSLNAQAICNANM